jgi:hypothetical protein
MERRDMLKGMALAAVSATAAGTAQAQSKPESVGVVDVTPGEPNYYIPNRFKGKTLLVTGCARGMGAAAASSTRRSAPVIRITIGSAA